MSRPLPLAPDAKPCVGSGLCCKSSACAFGTWDYEAKQCESLIEKEDGSYECGKYEEILSLPREEWWINPAFGAGCCMSLFNTNRARLIAAGRQRAGHSGTDRDPVGVHE